jgi:hypothetical protein
MPYGKNPYLLIPVQSKDALLPELTVKTRMPYGKNPYLLIPVQSKDALLPELTVKTRTSPATRIPSSFVGYLGIFLLKMAITIINTRGDAMKSSAIPIYNRMRHHCCGCVIRGFLRRRHVPKSVAKNIALYYENIALATLRIIFSLSNIILSVKASSLHLFSLFADYLSADFLPVSRAFSERKDNKI